jgi:hypothetical protein
MLLDVLRRSVQAVLFSLVCVCAARSVLADYCEKVTMVESTQMQR